MQEIGKTFGNARRSVCKAVVCAIVACTASGAGASVLFDNGPFVTELGVGAGGANISRSQGALVGAGINSLSPIFGPLRNKAADNFTVPSGEQWRIETLSVYVYESKSSGGGTTPSINAFYPVIFESMPTGTDPTPLFGSFTANHFSSASFTNAFRVSRTGSATDDTRAIFEVVADVSALDWVVDAGDHWLAWQVDSTGANVQTNNSIPVTPRGLLPAQRNYRSQTSASGGGNSEWAFGNDPFFPAGDRGIDMAFTIRGTVIPEPGAATIAVLGTMMVRRRSRKP